MAETTYQMLWDCRACGTVALLGITHRSCPNCGSAQDPQRRYFPEPGKEIAAEGHVYAGADKICRACNCAQSAKASFCGTCGSGLDAAKEATLLVDAPSSLDAAAARVPGAASREAEQRRRQGQTPEAPVKTPSSPWPGRIFKGLAAVVVLFIGLFMVERLWTKAIELEVGRHTWSREIDVETFRADARSDWCDSKPSDSYDISKTRKQKGTEKVADGETCAPVRTDNGDGTFSKSNKCTTKYKSVPTYADWCSFKVDRWVVTDTRKASGESKEPTPAWPKVEGLRGGSGLGAQRIGPRREKYVAHFTAPKVDLACDYSEGQWKTFNVKQKVSASQGVLLGSITCDSIDKGAKAIAH